MTDTQVLVMGGGISGTITACLLHDRGIDTAIVDPASRLVDAASRWNDGKIHLGYTFMGTPSLATAALMQDGAGAFLDVLERVIGGPLPASAWGEPVVYVVDETSLETLDVLWGRAQAVAAMLVDKATLQPGLRAYLPAGTAVVERLDRATAARLTGQERITGGILTTEIHLSARTIATGLRAAVAARGIPVIRARVESVHPVQSVDPVAVDRHGRWQARTDDGAVLRAAALINATWQDRVRLDRQVRPDDDRISIRYKHCIYGRWPDGMDPPAPSTRIVGPFGDFTCYGDREVYLSWYPSALAARSEDGLAPAVPPLDRARLIRETVAALGFPASLETAVDWEIGGGYVVAHGYGDVDDPASPLHERHRPAVTEPRPGFISIDTGKYTMGPLFAARAADLVAAALRGTRPAAQVGLGP